MPSNNVVGRWMENPVLLLGVWFDPELHVEKNWAEELSWVTHVAMDSLLINLENGSFVSFGTA